MLRQSPSPFDTGPVEYAPLLAARWIIPPWSVIGSLPGRPAGSGSTGFPGSPRAGLKPSVAEHYGLTASPDLFVMLRHRSSAGTDPRMGGIRCVFQILWTHYGLLVASRPVIDWNVVAVFINFLSVRAFFHFARKEKARRPSEPASWQVTDSCRRAPSCSTS